MRAVTVAAVAAGALAGALVHGPAAAHPSRPWPARRPSVEPKPAHQLRDCATWPAEPPVPDAVDDAHFRAAFAHLCRVDEDGAVAALSHQILAAAREASVDPFLLASTAYYGSACRPDFKSPAGVGLFAVDADMYRADGAPAPPVPRADLARGKLLDPESAIPTAAHLLAYWRDQHAEIDAAFGSVPHRSEVSHMVWGDDVRSSGHEDLILTARRRMLVAYAGATDEPRSCPLGLAIVSPLEAPPRVATSGPGEERDGGARQHRGLDIVATMGEPVRAIADGVVIFAGANVPGHPRKGPIPPEKIGRYTHRRLGVGGIYLCIEHDHDRKVVSCYMHLSSYVVSDEEHVTAGQTIGFVGRTGVKVSPPHLHLEVRAQERFTNPVRTLGDLVIPPKATLTHQRVMRAKRAKRLRAEAAPATALPAG
jgi:murein DD-endopeptidase MepM/ murein hydrolase activator NlpD